MASTFTDNLGIEKPGAGEQAGTWGTTTNTNFDIIDRAINGVVSLTLSGTTTTLTTTDGTLSDGGYKVLVLGGSPSGTNTITISPNDQDKVYLVKNSSGQTATFTQGSGGNASVSNGETAWIFADGAGSGAAVEKVEFTLAADSVNTAAITDANVTTAKLADSAVTTAKITDANVTTAKLADDAVTAAKIADDAVGSDQIADNAVALSTQTTGNYVTDLTAGNAITVSGGGAEGANITVNHADTSSQASVDNSGNTFIQDITLDTYGHVTALTSATHVPINDGTSVGQIIFGKFLGQTNVYYSGAFTFTPTTAPGPQLYVAFWKGTTIENSTAQVGSQITSGTWKALTFGMSSDVNFGFVYGLFIRIS